MRSLISGLRGAIENRSREMYPEDPIRLIDYIHKLIDAFAISSGSRSRNILTDHLRSSIPEPLSERELEVLRLMAGGLSNRDIANKDIVSMNTVKTQVKSIYSKLGVHNREDAITTARELGLL
jgi:LuxR family maltose regulon positive regulatory protein